MVGTLLIGHAMVLIATPDRRAFHTPSLVFACMAMALVLVWSGLQLVPGLLPSATNGFLASIPDALARPVQTHLAIDSERATQGLVKLSAYCGLFWLCVHLARDELFARNVTWTIIGSATLITIYGWLMQVTTQSCVVLTVIKRPLESGDPCAFSATFVNSGNYATYSGIACLICTAHLQALMSRADGQVGTREHWRRRIVALFGQGSIYLAMLVILLVALAFTASKSGLLSFVVAAVVMMTMTSAIKVGLRRSLLSSIAGAAVLTFVAVIIAGGGVVMRYLNFLNSGDPDRAALVSLTLDAISQRPWTGWGLGSFEALYSVLQPPFVRLAYDKAHSVYLENALDLGIPVSVLLVSAVVALAWRCVRGLGERRRNLQYPAIALGATVLIALHSIQDFGVQMPATALTFAALLAIGWAQSWSSRQVPPG